MDVWKNKAHLDGFIYLFKDGADEIVRSMNSAPDAVEEYVGGVEDAYFSDNLDECPYDIGFETFEDFLESFAHDFRKLEEENDKLRDTLLLHGLKPINTLPREELMIDLVDGEDTSKSE